MPEIFSFTSNELQWVIETAVEKAVNKMGIKSSLIEEKRGRKKLLKIKGL